jgi:hypothetical protein
MRCEAFVEKEIRNTASKINKPKGLPTREYLNLFFMLK